MKNGSVKGIVHGKTIILEQDLGLPEGIEVVVQVKTAIESTPDAILHLASQVYEGFSNKEIAELEEAHLRRRQFFKPGER